MSANILVVDDEPNICVSLSRSLSLEGYNVETAGTASEGERLAAASPVDLVMLDVRLPDGSGLDVLAKLKELRPQLPIIVMSGHGNVEMALEAIRAGAHDFIEKPLATRKILLTISNALKFTSQSKELTTLRARFAGQHELLGDSTPMNELRRTIDLASPTNARVLITGESGTGKELIARAVHRQSKRSDRPFIKLNCAAIPSDLIESELFGHERGAFTGAHAARKGKFELAHRGTLFLDEVGDMRLDVQAKLLRALQEGEIERVGGARTIRVDVRVVAATNKDLEAGKDDGSFREDSYYRLNVVPIQAPPLRARKDDIEVLVRAFVVRICADNDVRRKEITPEAFELLRQHDWPGNVRELRNACERLVILTPGEEIDARAVRRLLGGGRSVAGGLYRRGVAMRELVAEAEREIITAALDDHSGHVTNTAATLGLERSHLYKKMRALEIQR